jgi:hypothetical protein
MESPQDNDRRSLSSSRSSSNTNANTNKDVSEEPDVLSHPKAEKILEACKWRDIGRLTALAEAHGGFLSDTLRRQACMSVPISKPSTSTNTIPKGPFY